jgi:hypothetical protein
MFQRHQHPSPPKGRAAANIDTKSDYLTASHSRSFGDLASAPGGESGLANLTKLFPRL